MYSIDKLGFTNEEISLNFKRNFISLINYDKIPVGKFENLEQIRLKWDGPDCFKFITRKDVNKRFRFIRHTGEPIEPKTFYTDGGSIPKFFQNFSKELEAWYYGPAYLIHDWEFACHRETLINESFLFNKNFKEVRDTMMEALKTLMNLDPDYVKNNLSSYCKENKIAFEEINIGISSYVAQKAWETNPDKPLPVDKPE